jgi:hypothetical protein
MEDSNYGAANYKLLFIHLYLSLEANYIEDYVLIPFPHIQKKYFNVNILRDDLMTVIIIYEND